MHAVREKQSEMDEHVSYIVFLTFSLNADASL